MTVSFAVRLVYEGSSEVTAEEKQLAEQEGVDVTELSLSPNEVQSAFAAMVQNAFPTAKLEISDVECEG